MGSSLGHVPSAVTLQLRQGLRVGRGRAASIQGAQDKTQACQDTSSKDDDQESHVEEVPLESLGIYVPTIPGDIGLSGDMSEATTRMIAPRYKSWVYMNASSNLNWHPQVLAESGIVVKVLPFPGPPSLPTEQQAQDMLDGIDSLPRPLMLQCTSAMRAGAALLLWLAKKRSYCDKSAEQLATDANLRFWTDCTRCGPMREWLLKQLPDNESLAVQAMDSDLIFRQLYDPESSTFTYLLACGSSKEAILIDAVLEQKERDLNILNDLGLHLKYILSTHVHADHVTSGGLIRKELPHVKTVISAVSGARADIKVSDGEIVTFGKFSIKAIFTPGHTNGCTTWYFDAVSPAMAFTGDTLLIRGCGRTDFQEGCAERLYDSVHKRIYTLPGETLIFPAHDYKGRNVSTVEEEKRFNLRLTKSKADFVKIMSELKLAYPKKIDVALPANLLCGVQDDDDALDKYEGFCDKLVSVML